MVVMSVCRWEDMHTCECVRERGGERKREREGEREGVRGEREERERERERIWGVIMCVKIVS